MSAVAIEPEAHAFAEHGDPFTLDHFEPWAYSLELDTGGAWRVEDYFAAFLDDYFSGVPESWLLVPEGNAKTTSLAGLAVYLLEFRPCASIPWAASSRDQAEIGYRQAEGFIRRSDRLRPLLKCQDGYRRIKNLATAGRMQVFAADDGTGDGVIFTDAFLDELHRHKNLRLYRTWQGKLDKRGGQMAAISTAGEPGSEFEDTRELIRQGAPVIERRPGFVRCLSQDIAFHEYAVSEGADVEDMDAVKAANPASFLTKEKLARKRGRPTMTLEHWRRFTCNLPTRGGAAAIGESEWDGAEVDDVIPPGEGIWLGLDVGWKWDTTSMVRVYAPDPSVRRLLGETEILEPPRDGTSLDPHAVEEALREIHRVNPIHTVVMDTTRAEQLASWIEEELGCEVVDRGQGNALAALDYSRFMEALRNGVIKHTGDPGLRRHVLNAVARMLSAEAAKFDRPASSRRGEQSRREIDALIAAAMVNCVIGGEAGDEFVFEFVDPFAKVAA